MNTELFEVVKRSKVDVEQPDSTVDTQKQEKTDSEEASKVSESKPVETNAIYIKGFVRPLILRNAEELAKKYGNVKKFWMDSIKTHCYVIVSETLCTSIFFLRATIVQWEKRDIDLMYLSLV